MTTSTAQIKELREKTGAGILDCREALETSGGDLEKAVELLREKGLAAAQKRAGRLTNAGVLDLYSHGEGRIGVMVEVNCETDFVARTEEFRGFAHEIALQVAANSPNYLTKDDVPEDVISMEQESARKQAVEEGKIKDEKRNLETFSEPGRQDTVEGTWVPLNMTELSDQELLDARDEIKQIADERLKNL